MKMHCHFVAGPEGPQTEKEKEEEPLENWRRKDLAAECRALGLSDHGVKAVLIDRIKKARAATEESKNDE